MEKWRTSLSLGRGPSQPPRALCLTHSDLPHNRVCFALPDSWSDCKFCLADHFHLLTSLTPGSWEQTRWFCRAGIWVCALSPGRDGDKPSPVRRGQLGAALRCESGLRAAAPGPEQTSWRLGLLWKLKSVAGLCSFICFLVIAFLGLKERNVSHLTLG